jgi:hypothetical protein
VKKMEECRKKQISCRNHIRADSLAASFPITDLLSSQPMTFLKPLLPLIPLIFLSGITHGQTDDFNDGDDSGWTRQDSIGLILSSSHASYSFPDGGYRISAGNSPAPLDIGPSRAASFRQDVAYNGRLFLSVDLKISDPFIQQAAGFLAFVQPNPAPGAVAGYSLSFQPLTGDIVLNRIVGEQPFELAYSDLEGVASESLRLVLVADNGQLSGAVYNLSDLVNPIAKVTASDSTYTTGTAGLFVFSDTEDASGPVDTVFDNYRANPMTVPELSFILDGDNGYLLSWPDWAVHFSPSLSTTLTEESWQPVLDSELQTGGGVLFHIGDRTNVPKKFFRLERRQF